MQVILCEDVKHLGQVGDIVGVKAGYGRNYLVPRGFAMLASSRNVKQLEHHKQVISKREEKLLRNAEALKSRIAALSLTFARRVGEEEKLYGSVTSKDVARALEEKGVSIDRKQLVIDSAIRTLGLHQVQVALSSGLSAELKVWVVAE